MKSGTELEMQADGQWMAGEDGSRPGTSLGGNSTLNCISASRPAPGEKAGSWEKKALVQIPRINDII